MFDRILIPTDGSQPARRAAETGVDLAREHDATVQALYVIDPVYAEEAGSQKVSDALQRKAERTVGELAELAESAGLAAETEVRTGTAYDEIIDASEDLDSDVIVMGTHGRTGLGRYLLGSVTQKVVRLSDVPVLTVRTGPDQD